MSVRAPFISFSGLIGAGKSTIAENISRFAELKLYKEPVESNPYLSLFYADKAKHSFQLQIYLLKERFRQQQQIIWSEEGGVQDRSIYEDLVFARMLTKAGFMSELDLATYTDLFWVMARFMKTPSTLVFLEISPELALARIRERGRECEAGITLEYLQQLRAEYDIFLAEISDIVKVLRVPVPNFNREEVAKLTATGLGLPAELPKSRHYFTVGEPLATEEMPKETVIAPRGARAPRRHDIYYY
jgi:deoxyadenosine kinase